jgi:cell division ATPase FtsA
MGIFSGEKKNELALVFNVGSSSVGGALISTQSSGIPKIIFSVNEPIKVEEAIDIDRFLILTIQSLLTVVKKVYEAHLGAPTKIFCVLSSPWYTSQTRIISYKKNTPFVFTTKLADSLIQKEISIFEEEHKLKYKEIENSVRPIELKNIKTILNGYETSNPLNKQAKELEMTVFVSIAGEQVLKKIENEIGKYFHSNSIKFFSFAMASFAVVRDMYVDKENFLLVDIGGEITDISMVKKNILRESITFPLGRNFLIRGVASEMGCTLDEADSLISLLKDGHAEEKVLNKLSSVLDSLRKEWLKNFQDSLANISKDISVPSTIYIAIDKDLAGFFLETIKTEQFSQYTLTESKFEVTFLDAQTLHGLAMFEETALRDPFLIIDSIYINRFLTKK